MLGRQQRAADRGGQAAVHQRAIQPGAALRRGHACGRTTCSAPTRRVRAASTNSIGKKSASPTAGRMERRRASRRSSLPCAGGRGAPRAAGGSTGAAPADAGRRARSARSDGSTRAQDFVGVDVADDDQRRVVGDVVAPVVAVQIVARHRLEIAQPADRRMAVGVRLRRRRRSARCRAAVPGSFSPPFSSEMMTVRSDSQSSGSYRHALIRSASMKSIRSSASRRRRFEIGRLVDPGVAVPGAAKLLDDALDLVARDVPRPLEVHVLDPVRDAGQPGPFVLRADPVPAPDRGQRRGVDLLDEHLQAVVEDDFADGGSGQLRGATRPYGHYYNRQTAMPEWKDTCNLPRTGFSMKANLQTAEPEAIARWQGMDLVRPAPPAREPARPSSCCTTARRTPTARFTSGPPSTRSSRTSS